MTVLTFDTTLDLERMHRDRQGRLVAAMSDAGRRRAAAARPVERRLRDRARVPSADQARAIHRRAIALVTADGDGPHVWTWYPEGAGAVPADHRHAGVSLEWDASAGAFVAEIVALVAPGATLAVDELTMPLRAALADAGSRSHGRDGVLGAAKVQKTDDEIECIRRAQTINEAAIADVALVATPGTPATALTGCFLGRVLELGASWNNVDPIWQAMPDSIADGPYSATGGVVFPTATTPRELRKGDVIWVDNGLAYEGYMSDYGHTWVVGEQPNARQRDRCRRWRDVVAATLGVTRPGATARDLTRAAVAAAGGGAEPASRPWLPHLYLAHGSGTESAEPPFVGTDLGDEFDESVVLAPGMVMVLEPVIWDDGDGGFRAEQVIAVTQDGWTSLSNLTWDGWE